MKQRKPYEAPRLVSLGSVNDLTRAGNTTPIVRDFKNGSNLADPPGLKTAI